MFDKYKTYILSVICRSMDNVEQGRRQGAVVTYKTKKKIVVITITGLDEEAIEDLDNEEDEQD